MDHIYAIYKPSGPSSHDIIRELRRITGIKKIGHGGTLDPLARGVLVIGIGREATRKLKDILGGEKEYIAAIRLGMRSATDDEEGDKEEICSVLPPSREEIEAVCAKFTGHILQTPPLYSAVKIAGRAAYTYARKGRQISLNPREVYVKEIKILKYAWPFLSLRIVTGPGVYVRALARDMGEELKTGGYLAALERVRVGQFLKNDAKTLGDIKKEFQSASA